MRLVLDTNVLVSALFSRTSLPAHLVVLWRERRFQLVTAADQFDELIRVTRYPQIRERIMPALAGRLTNEMRDFAIIVSNLQAITACTDPSDNYLLAMASIGAADFLITGDKADLLGMDRHEGTKIVTVRDFLAIASRGRHHLGIRRRDHLGNGGRLHRNQQSSDALALAALSPVRFDQAAYDISALSCHNRSRKDGSHLWIRCVCHRRQQSQSVRPRRSTFLV